MTRKKYTSKFKAKVVLEALKERSSVADLTQKHWIGPATDPSMEAGIPGKGRRCLWIHRQEQKIAGRWGKGRIVKSNRSAKSREWFFKVRLAVKPLKERRSMISKGQLSLVQQCMLLSIHRSGLYYKPKGESALNLELMRALSAPFIKGARRLHTWLSKDKGYKVSLNRIERLYYIFL